MQMSNLMELPLQANLSEYLSSSTQVRLKVLKAIAQALDRLHDEAEVHGQVNPTSILIGDDPETKQISAKLAAVDAGVEGGVLHTDAVAEPAYYLAPERLVGLDLTSAADQFSLAVLAYQFVYGELPFIASTTSELVYEICSQQPSFHSSDGPTPDHEVVQVFSRALAKNPQERYPTSSAFVDDLERAWIEPALPAETIPKAMAAAAGTQVAPIAAATGTITGGVSRSLGPNEAWARLSERQRRRLTPDEFDEPEAPKAPRRMLPYLIAALATSFIVIAYIARSSHPDLPQQVLDTHSGPATPPPADKSPAANPSRRAPLHPPEARNSGQSVPLNTPSRERSNPPAPSHAQISESTRRTPSPLSSSVDVRFQAEPSGVNIVVDKDPARSCKTPCAMSLPAGRHTLTASLDGYRMEQRILNVPETRFLNIPLGMRTGTLILTSDPKGSEIVVDGRPYGLTPLTLQLSPGPHRITIQDSGRSREETITIVPDAIQAKRISLQ